MKADVCGGGCAPQTPCDEIDSSVYRIIQDHPCFSEKAQHTFGRMHLPVAPKCNVKCKYCVRRFDCANESRPGVTSQVLSPSEALVRVREVTARFPNIKTIAVAGPGEPLYNEETFDTLGMVRDEFPHLRLCLSTNGLLLPDRLDTIERLGVGTVTVTINAVDPKISKGIYSWVRHDGRYYRGLAGARLLISKQVAGVSAAVKRGIVVKVNTVLIPTVNDQHVIEVAKKAREMGAYMLNIMPLIPQADFAHLDRPTAADRKAAQDECGKIIRQMRHCRQCRSDAIGLLGSDMTERNPGAGWCQVPAGAGGAH